MADYNNDIIFVKYRVSLTSPPDEDMLCFTILRYTITKDSEFNEKNSTTEVLGQDGWHTIPNGGQFSPTAKIPGLDGEQVLRELENAIARLKNEHGFG